MNWNIEKPFTIDEIRKYPYAVLIAFLIGMLVMFGTAIAVLWYRNNTADERCDERIEEKNLHIIQMQQEWIIALDDRDYYKQKVIAQQRKQDSIVKDEKGKSH
ncbi:hypothetical protein ACTJIJ_21845 [Niabella sp. 22666]|uniref:hypothetical protein n=1 Tax=Niabella sp. 22666 TaxID=3453954 RepID=UPI003F850665